MRPVAILLLRASRRDDGGPPTPLSLQAAYFLVGVQRCGSRSLGLLFEGPTSDKPHYGWCFLVGFGDQGEVEVGP